MITADAGYHSAANLKAQPEQHINAYLPANGYRKRDEHYADQGVRACQPDTLWNKAKRTKKSKRFKPADFRLAEDQLHCVCLAGIHQRLRGGEIQRGQTGLRAVRAPPGMFA